MIVSVDLSANAQQKENQLSDCNSKHYSKQSSKIQETKKCD